MRSEFSRATVTGTLEITDADQALIASGKSRKNAHAVKPYLSIARLTVTARRDEIPEFVKRELDRAIVACSLWIELEQRAGGR